MLDLNQSEQSILARNKILESKLYQKTYVGTIKEYLDLLRRMQHERELPQTSENKKQFLQEKISECIAIMLDNGFITDFDEMGEPRVVVAVQKDWP